MDLGLHVASFTWPGVPEQIAPTLTELARSSEEAGVVSISVMDHYFQLEQFAGADEPMIEAYTTLGYLASATSTISLGVLVTGVTYRHPALLAKIVSTLDVLSEGRARLGIGAAWYEREHRGLGVPFPPLAERFERLEETIQICRQMWSGEGGSFHGRHYQLEEMLSSPPTVSQPHPPIMIGGGGEKKTLRLVARHADACNLFSSSVDDVRHKLEVLRGHCDAEGTDYDRIEKTILWVAMPPVGDESSRFLAEMERYAALGVECVYVMPMGKDPVGCVEALGSEVIPGLKNLAR
jgi:F420-dependent oxidoreductase-like protein